MTFKSTLFGAVAALALVGCGGDKGDEAASDNAPMSAKLSEQSPLDKPFTLKDGEPLDVEAFLASMGMAGAIEYGSTSFDEASGATILTDVAMAGDQATTIGRVEIYGLNEDAISALQSGDGMAAPAELFTKIRIFDLQSSFPIDQDPFAEESAEPLMGTVTVGALEVDQLVLQVPSSDAAMEMEEDANFAMQAKAMQMGGMAMKDISMAMPMSEGAGFSFSSPDMRIRGYKEGKFDGLYAKNLSYDVTQSPEAIEEQIAAMGPQAAMLANSPLRNILFPEQTSGKIDQVKWDGLSFRGMLPWLESGETPPTTASDLISVGGMEILGQTTSINGKPYASVARTTMAPIEFVHFMPKQIKMESKGGKADLTALVGEENPEIADILVKNGLNDVKSESSLLWNYDPKAQTIALDMDATSDKLMDLTFNLGLSSFDYAAFVSGDEDNQAAMMATALNSMTLNIEDKSLLDTVFAIAGAVQGQDPATLRSQVVGLVTMGALQGGQISPRVPAYATALSTWLQEGGSLEIKVAPAEPASFGAIAIAGQTDPGSVLETLNLTVEQSK